MLPLEHLMNHLKQKLKDPHVTKSTTRETTEGLPWMHSYPLEYGNVRDIKRTIKVIV